MPMAKTDGVDADRPRPPDSPALRLMCADVSARVSLFMLCCMNRWYEPALSDARPDGAIAQRFRPRLQPRPERDGRILSQDGKVTGSLAN